MPSLVPTFDLGRPLKRVLRDWWFNPEKNVTGVPIPLVIGLPPTETGNLSSPLSSLSMYIRELDDVLGGVSDYLFPNKFGNGPFAPMQRPSNPSSWIASIFNKNSAVLARAAKELAISSEIFSKEMFPILEVIPCVPKAVSGTNIFKLEEAWELYHKILNFLGYRLIDNKSLRIAVQADSFPSETFTNDYGESFLERFTSLATSGAAELGYMTGSRDFSQLVDEMEGILPKQVADQIKKIRGNISAGAQAASQNVNNKFSKSVADTAQLISKMSVGSRIDFPSVWKNSAFGPTWTFTTRLYNPHPLDKVSTWFYIMGPLAAMLSLALPITEDGITYSWPFLLKCRIPGYLDGMATYIQSMTVIKGGDQQQVGFNQRLGMVDVRFELGCLYDTMLATTGKIDNSDRPTLKKYLDVMAEEKSNLFKRSKDFFSYLDRSASQLTQTGRQLALILKYGKNYVEKWHNKAKNNTQDKP